jgi:hypothetical protein
MYARGTLVGIALRDRIHRRREAGLFLRYMNECETRERRVLAPRGSPVMRETGLLDQEIGAESAVDWCLGVGVAIGIGSEIARIDGKSE